MSGRGRLAESFSALDVAFKGQGTAAVKKNKVLITAIDFCVAFCLNDAHGGRVSLTLQAIAIHQEAPSWCVDGPQAGFAICAGSRLRCRLRAGAIAVLCLCLISFYQQREFVHILLWFV